MYEKVTYVVHLVCLRQPAVIGTARMHHDLVKSCWAVSSLAIN